MRAQSLSSQATAFTSARIQNLMDLATFESLRQSVIARAALQEALTVEDFMKPRSFQIIVQDSTRPRTAHHLIIFPCEVEGMIVKKSWTYDHESGIQTPIQGRTSPDRVLDEIDHWLRT